MGTCPSKQQRRSDKQHDEERIHTQYTQECFYGGQSGRRPPFMRGLGHGNRDTWIYWRTEAQ